MSDLPQPLTYRVKQVAALLNVPASGWVRSRTIASVRVGKGGRKVTLIPVAAVQEFMEQHLQRARLR